MQYRREIDGLRAIAVLPVILFHAGFTAFSGGFIGVDVFFVISGYLITSLIVSEKEAGHYSIARFYERRARRILPALFLVMFACLPVAWWIMLPDDLRAFSRSLIAVPLFVSNILFRKESGYFETSAELKPLLHTWSLAIEEQYYVLFPLLIILAWKFGRVRIITLLTLLAIASLAYAEWKVIHKPSDAFYLLPFRAWELLLGALIAFHHRGAKEITHDPKWLHELGPLLGMALIAYGVFTFNKLTPFPGLHALVPTIGAALIILFARPGYVVGDVLCSKPLVGIGLISYSAYLWHFPAFAFLRLSGHENPSALLLLLVCAASLMAAYFSWRYVEKPFRDISIIQRRTVFLSALAASLFFIVLGNIGRLSDGFENYFVTKRLSLQEQEIYRLIHNQTGGSMYDDMVDDGECRFWSRQVDDAFTARFEQCAKGGRKAIVVLGDSHAMNIFNMLSRAYASPFIVGISQGDCRPYDARPNCHYAGFGSFIDAHTSSVALLIYHQSGAYLLKDRLGLSGSKEIFTKQEPYSLHQENIDKLKTYLGTLPKETKLLWLGPFVEAHYDFRNFRKNGPMIAERNIAIMKELDAALKADAQSANIRYLSLVDTFNIQPDFLRQGDCITYRDADHFSICGESIVGKMLTTRLKSISKK